MQHSARHSLQCGLVCLLALLVGTSGGKGHEPQPEQQSWPNAWAWITTQPQLSNITTILTLIGADVELSGPFTGTLLLPTNEALAEYLGQLRVPLEIAGTDAMQSFWKLFFSKLVAYHVLLGRVYAKQWAASEQHTTRYYSINGSPHLVTFVANSSCTPVLPTHTMAGAKRSKYNMAVKPCHTAAVLDEQGTNTTFAPARTTVQGGGVIHTLNAVLQPNDIYPSLTAALSSPYFTTLASVIQLIDAALNITMLADIEKTPGTLAAPTNEAFAGLNVTDFNASTLLSIVTYHFCPDTQAYKLVYTPFTYPTRRNPCTTLLARTTNNLDLKLTYRMKSMGWGQDPKLWISYPTSIVVNGTTLVNNSTANINMADITVPLHVCHVISKLLVPPV